MSDSDQLERMNLLVQSFEGVDPVETRILDAKWRTLASRLSECSPVVYDTFYVYESEDE